MKKYQQKFINLLSSIRVTDKHGKKLDMYQAIEIVGNMIKKESGFGSRIFFIGNGGSAAIASHMTVDFWKNGGMPAMAFNDSSLLTCVSNDFGYERVFEKPLAFFARKNDVLFAISSSGKSRNILKGVQAALGKGCTVITLSGFHKNNPLSGKGHYNFYVPTAEYGAVEVIHQYLCHFILDFIMQRK